MPLGLGNFIAPSRGDHATGRVFGFAIDSGRTVVAGVLTAWTDQVAGVNAVQSPAGFSVAPQAVQQYDGQRGGSGIAMRAAAATLFAPGAPRTVYLVGSLDNEAANGTAFATGAAGGGNYCYLTYGVFSSFGLNAAQCPGDSPTHLTTYSPDVCLRFPSIVAWTITPGAGKATLRVNGYDIATTGASVVDTQNLGVLLGNREDFAGFEWIGLYEEAHGWARILSAADLAREDGVLANKFKVVGVRHWQSDTDGYFVPTALINLHAPYAVTRLQTSAPSIDVTAVCTVTGVTNENQLCVFVDGLLRDVFTVPIDSNAHTFTTALDGLPHTLEIWDGTNGTGAAGGTTLVQVQDASGRTALLPAAISSRRLVGLHDSIGMGFLASNPSLGSWGLMRQRPADWAGRISFCGHPGATIFEYFNADPTFAPIVATMAGLAGEVDAGGLVAFYITLGTNDWNLADFATAADAAAAAAALVDGLHAAFPAAVIVWRTPIVRSSEGPNAAGWTLQDLRDALVALVGGRPWLHAPQGNVAFAGRAPVAVGQLVDGVHPSDAGHATLEAFDAAVLAAYAP